MSQEQVKLAQSLVKDEHPMGETPYLVVVPYLSDLLAKIGPCCKRVCFCCCDEQNASRRLSSHDGLLEEDKPKDKRKKKVDIEAFEESK